LQNRPHIQEKVRPIISSEEIRLKHIIADNVVNLEFVNYETLINKSAREYDIDPSIIFAQIHKESGYNPTALDYNNALGLMQVTPIAFKEMKRLYERKFFLMEQLKDKSLSDSIRKKYEWEFKQIRHIHSLPDKHSDLRDPSLNIGVGMQVLKYYIERRKA
jgi:soluble lytic murein transglycosylase-like protein